MQRKLNHNRAVLRVEAPRVAKSYATLVESTRRIAGGAIHEGWNLAPITADTSVHVTDVDLTGIKAYEDAYLTTVADHLALMPRWARTALRWVGRRIVGVWSGNEPASALVSTTADNAPPEAKAA